MKPIKSMNDIAITLAALEGKKKQMSIAQIREVLARLSEVAAKDPMAIAVLIKNGCRRVK